MVVYQLEEDFYKMSFEEILNEVDIVIFDFFDTIMGRKVDDETLIHVWASEVAVKLKYKMSATDIYDSRRKASIILFNENRNTEEADYQSIIKKIYTLCHERLSDMSYSEFFTVCYTTEIEIECRKQYLITETISFINKARSQGKKIGIMSDYYLGKKELAVFLKDKGIEINLFEDILVSSEIGVKKKTGHAYKKVKERFGENYQYLMIGDNKISDIKKAEENGFLTFKVPEVKNASTKSIDKELTKIASEFKRKAFSNYAFGLYLYIERIYEYAVKNEIHKLAFLSREGYFLKELFDIYQIEKPVKIESKYLCVSRMATFLPSLSELEIENFETITRQYGDLSLAAFLKNLQFSKELIEMISDSMNIDSNSIIYGFGNSKVYYDLKKSEVFINEYNRLRRAAKIALHSYITNTMGNEESIVLVDVGWKGTMQDNLYKAFDGEKSFIGLYFGIFNQTGNECYKNIKHGLVFNKFPKYSRNFSIWEFETHLIEQLLAAPHGSTVRYELLENGYVPVFEQSTDDKKVYEITAPIQKNIKDEFIQINDILKNVSATLSENIRLVERIQLGAELKISSDMIKYEKIALSEKTNNFGWFSVIPINNQISKFAKLKEKMKVLKRIHKNGESGTLMKYLGYIAIKMNAKECYKWKRIIYPCVYFIEIFRVRRK